MVRNILIILLLLPLIIMLFMPKKELYYLLEQKLDEQNIVISGETLKEGPLGLTIEDSTLYFNGAPLATARYINLWSVLYYTKLDIKDLVIAEGLPTEVSSKALTATHSILAPFYIKAEGNSSLGEMNGTVRINERKVQINIAGKTGSRALLKYFKKSRQGWTYESKF